MRTDVSKNQRSQDRIRENARILKGAPKITRQTELSLRAAVAAVSPSYKGSDVHEGFIFRLTTDKLPKDARLVAEVSFAGEARVFHEDAPGLTDEVLAAAAAWLHEYCDLVPLDRVLEKIDAAASRWRSGEDLGLDDQVELRTLVLSTPPTPLAHAVSAIVDAAPPLSKLTLENARSVHPVGLVGRVLLSPEDRIGLYPAVQTTPSWARIAVLRTHGDAHANYRISKMGLSKR